jgi:hypothetical protein
VRAHVCEVRMISVADFESAERNQMNQDTKDVVRAISGWLQWTLQPAVGKDSGCQPHAHAHSRTRRRDCRRAHVLV